MAATRSSLSENFLSGLAAKQNFFGLIRFQPERITCLEGDGDSPRIESSSFSTVSCLIARLALISDNFCGLSISV